MRLLTDCPLEIAPIDQPPVGRSSETMGQRASADEPETPPNSSYSLDCGKILQSFIDSFVEAVSMVTVDERVVDDISLRERHYRIEDFVTHIERHHHGDEPGISMALIDAYSDELGYDRDRTNALVEEHLTDSETWEPGINLYRVGENVSVYPSEWHERLADTIDVDEYVRVMLESRRPPDGSEPNRAQWGIPQQEVLTAIEIMTGLGRDRGEELLGKQRREGNIVIYAYQNPEDLVRLPEADR